MTDVVQRWLTTLIRTLNLMSTIPLPNERPVYMSIIVVVYSIGAVLGPIVGGLLGDSSATWRWVSLFALCEYFVPSISHSIGR